MRKREKGQKGMFNYEVLRYIIDGYPTPCVF
jgi:hypothetical protein